MNSEIKVCQNCDKNFTVGSDDLIFYEKIKVPTPKLCPDCRQQRRYAWRNERTLYRRDCDLCGKSTVTIYSPNKPYKVYCLSCWWGDKWDPSEYGVDFDFTRPFFEQFSQLQHQVPRMALLNKNNLNSDYSNHSSDSKNAYLSFTTSAVENVFYSSWVFKSKDCLDCSYVYEKGEKCYVCIDVHSLYRCQYCVSARDCMNCYYLYDCNGCNDCFMSSNLRNKSYVFRNQQLTKEKYLEKMKGYNLSSFSEREKLKLDFENLIKNDSIHKDVSGERNINSKGNMIFENKNCYNCFDLDVAEDCKNVFSGLDMKDCVDIYHAGIKMELCYECHACLRIYDNKFVHLCYDDVSLTYCDSCHNSQNLFGCISVKKGEYMIFNKKYSKEEYEKLKEKIIEHMEHTGEYGEFFPPSIAPVSYNETQGNYYTPMTKEEVLARGWQWEDRVPGTFGKETIKEGGIPDKIEDVGDEIVKSTLKCNFCAKNYNIIPDELNFYKTEGIPLPHSCPDCRYKYRFSFRPERKLYKRVCGCQISNHFHGDTDCKENIETSYSPNRPEKVFCKACYQAEVL